MNKLKQTKNLFKNLSKMKKVYFMQQIELLERCTKKIRFFINII